MRKAAMGRIMVRTEMAGEMGRERLALWTWMTLYFDQQLV